MSGFEHWDRVEGELIRFLIVGPLYWLGMVDLGVDRPPDPPLYFRLTSAGVGFISNGAQPSETPAGKPDVRSDLSIIVPAACRYERFQLSRVADWVHSGAEYTYRINGNSLERAKRQGITINRVLEFLREAAGKGLPSSVSLAITNWEKQGSKARLERVIAIRVDDEKSMDRLLATPTTRELIGERIGPTTAFVRKRDWRRLASALAELGILPDVVGVDEDPTGL